MKIIKILLSIIVIAIAALFLVPFLVLWFAIGNTDSKTHIFTDFKCQGETFTVQKELELGKYFLTDYDTRGYDEGEPIRVYPVGSEFKILRAHSSYNFSSGGMTTLLVEDEEGSHGHVFLRNIDPSTCQMEYYYNHDDKRISLRDAREIMPEDENITRKTPPPTDRNVWYEQQEDKYFVKSIFNSSDTLKPNLYLHLSSKRYWHYVRRIIEKNREHMEKYDLILKDDGTVLPNFTVDKNSFNAFSCDYGYADMYECFNKDFPKWLKEPYKSELPFKISSPAEVYEDIKNDEKFPLVFYMKDFHYDTYRRVLSGLKKLDAESNASVLLPRIGKKRFLIVGERVISQKTEYEKEKRFYISDGINIVSRDGSSLAKYFSGDHKLLKRMSKFTFEKFCSDPVFKYHSIEEAKQSKKNLFIVFTKRKGCYAIDRITKENFPKDLSNYAVVQLHQYTEEYDKYIKYFNVGDFEYNYVVVSSNKLHKINESKISFSEQNRKKVRNILK